MIVKFHFVAITLSRLRNTTNVRHPAKTRQKQDSSEAKSDEPVNTKINIKTYRVVGSPGWVGLTLT